MQRILNAEKVRGAHRKKQADKKKAQEQGMFSQSQPSQPLAESSKAGSSAPGQGNKKVNLHHEHRL